MYPYDQNNYNQNSSASWDNDSGTYHYSYARPDAPQPETPQKKPGKSRKGAVRAVSLVLCCALAGGGAGVGGAAVYSALNAPAQGEGPTIYRNDTTPTPVKVSQADGLTPMSLAEINAAYADSCVCISVQAIVQNGWYQQTATGAGSGFIISEDGYIVTNYHVIDGATAIRVTLNNGDQYDAKLVGGEELNDVAVLKIDGVTGLKPVVLGDSDDLVVGETVCTIGNALGTLSFSLTSGTVSANDRSVTMSDNTVMNMIQTDCTINSGNSGGPLFDSYGRVVGITSAKFSNNGDTSRASIEGIGFAIPINDVMSIITDYMQYGYVTGRPYMGIGVATVESEHQQLFGWPAGVYVNSVDAGSCAEKAGLQKGDIITRVGDTDVSSINELASVKNRYRAGDTVSLTVYRAGEELILSITFDEQENNTQNQTDPNPQETSSGNGSYHEYNFGNGSGNSGSESGGSFNPWDFFGFG